MIMLIAFFHPFLSLNSFADVDELHKIHGFPGLTVTKVQGFGRENET